MMTHGWQLCFVESSPDEGADEWQETVVIRNYQSESVAQLMSAYLEERHIPNFLANRIMNQLLPLGAASIALHVRRQDAQRAAELLQQREAELASAGEEQSPTAGDPATGYTGRSGAERPQRYGSPWIISLLVLIILLLLWHAMRVSGDEFRIW